MATPTTRDPPDASSPRSGQQAPAQAQRQAYRRRKARAKARSDARRQEEAGRVEALPVQHPHAAGIDIGSRSHCADRQRIVNLFPTTHRLAFVVSD